jgi:hypothetical protein
MTDPIDHRAQAEKYLRMFANTDERAPLVGIARATAANAHAALACAPDHTVCGEIADAVRDEYAELRDAVRHLLDHNPQVTVATGLGVILQPADVVGLRALVGE